MAQFRISRSHTLSRDALRLRARELARDLEREYGVRANWDNPDRVSIRGSGVTGDLSIHDDRLDVDVRLGLFASAFQKPLRAEIERFLDEHVG